MTQIKAFFNGRSDVDAAKKQIFAGIEGEQSEEIIPDIQTFLERAGRAYGILKVPALIRDPFGGVDDNGEICEMVREVDEQYHLMRNSDGCVVSPHTVTGQYAPLTLLDIAAECQPWVDAGWVTPDAVYSGKKESLELLCLRMDGAGQLDEPFEHYIIFHNPHATGGKAKGRIVSFRTSCANCFTSIGRGYEFTVGHRISAKMTAEEQQAEMQARTQRAAAAWNTAKEYISKLAAQIAGWDKFTLSDGEPEELTCKLLSIKDLDKASKRAQNRYDAIMEAYDMPQFGTNGLTAYDWYNAVTFVNSSQNSASVRESKVSSIDRMIRNTDVNGSGFKLECRAEDLLNSLVSGN